VKEISHAHGHWRYCSHGDCMAINIIAMVPVNEADRHGIPYTPQPYMVEHPCEACGNKGWIGPRQLGMKASDPTIPVLCMNCVLNNAQGVVPRVQNLGGV